MELDFRHILSAIEESALLEVSQAHNQKVNFMYLKALTPINAKKLMGELHDLVVSCKSLAQDSCTIELVNDYPTLSLRKDKNITYWVGGFKTGNRIKACEAIKYLDAIC